MGSGCGAKHDDNILGLQTSTSELAGLSGRLVTDISLTAQKLCRSERSNNLLGQKSKLKLKISEIAWNLKYDSMQLKFIKLKLQFLKENYFMILR